VDPPGAGARGIEIPTIPSWIALLRGLTEALRDGLECRMHRPRFRAISAVTLATHDMGRAVRFYRALGFEPTSGGEGAGFTSFPVGDSHLNLLAASRDERWQWWGRVILYVDDVDGLYGRALAAGLAPEALPRDAEWGERYFHLRDPDGHELSFARPLR
jgi:catechol 2,3-dioxygenase-like lactoylglutathione lyase family enzyme